MNEIEKERLPNYFKAQRKKIASDLKFKFKLF